MSKKNFFYAVGIILAVLLMAGAVFAIGYGKKFVSEREELKNQLDEAKNKLESEENKRSTSSSSNMGANRDSDNSVLPVEDAPFYVNVPINSDYRPDPSVLDRDGSENADENSKQKEGQPVQEDESPMNDNISASGQQKEYQNKKHGFSFAYPGNFTFGDCKKEKCPYGQVFEQQEGDLVFVNGRSVDRSWPFIVVTCFSQGDLKLNKEKSLLDWVKEKVPVAKDNPPKEYNFELNADKEKHRKAVRFGLAPTPQTYAREEIYFAKGSTVCQIQLMDPVSQEAKKFYESWIGTFKVGE